MDDSEVSFVSFGFAILDEIRFPSQKPLTNVLGGSSAYATLGARLFLPYPKSRSLAWLLRVGNDFPDESMEAIKSWDMTLYMQEKPDRKSPRGLLEYQDTTFGPKTFKYIAPPIPFDEGELPDTALRSLKVYHYLVSPEDIKERIPKLLALRKAMGLHDRPLVIWEPTPLSCKPENRQACLEAAALVDVFTPNHIELAKFLVNSSDDFFDNCSENSHRAKIEGLGREALVSGVGPEGKGTVLIRAGESGCVVQTKEALSGEVKSQWLAPFYQAKEGETQAAGVVDPTGAGNAFLGGFSIGYLQTGGSIMAAARYGAVAASFALEQVGMPTMSKEGNEELWNGTSVLGRLSEYEKLSSN